MGSVQAGLCEADVIDTIDPSFDNLSNLSPIYMQVANAASLMVYRIFWADRVALKGVEAAIGCGKSWTIVTTKKTHIGEFKHK